MEGKFASEGLQASDGDDDRLTAMACALVQNRGIDELADLLWKRRSATTADTVPILPSTDSNSTSSLALQLTLF